MLYPPLIRQHFVSLCGLRSRLHGANISYTLCAVIASCHTFCWYSRSGYLLRRAGSYQELARIASTTVQWHGIVFEGGRQASSSSTQRSRRRSARLYPTHFPVWIAHWKYSPPRPSALFLEKTILPFIVREESPAMAMAPVDRSKIFRPWSKDFQAP